MTGLEAVRTIRAGLAVGASVVTSVHAPRDRVIVADEGRTLVLHPMLLRELDADNLDDFIGAALAYLHQRIGQRVNRLIAALDAARETEVVDVSVDTMTYGGAAERHHVTYTVLRRP